MNRIAQRLVLDAAERQVTIGWGTGIAFTALRVVPLTRVLLSGTSIPWSTLLLLALEACLTAGLTYGVYRRRPGAAIGLFALWAVGFAYTWAQSGRWIPPLGLIGVLLGVGLFQGVRGTRAFRAVARDRVAAV